MKEKRQSERRAKEDFIYIIPENQKSVQPQSCHGNVCYKAKKQFVKDSRMDNSYIAGKILVWLELLIFCFFLYPMTKENRICTCRWVTVACKDLREWGWRRYGCVGSDWMLCAFGGVTCTVDWELMHGGDLHSFSNPCWRHWLLSHADSSKTGSKKMRFGYFFSPASFSELLLTSFIVMRSAFRIEYFSVPLSLRWQR